MAYRRQRYLSSGSESSDDDRSVASSRRSSGGQSARSNTSKAEAWRCQECYRDFPTRQGLNCHITAMHGRSRPSQDAPELEGFGQLSIRRSSERFQCSRCDRDYASQGNLNRHVREYHGASSGTVSNTNVRNQTNIQNNVKIQNNYFYYIRKN